MERGGRRAAGAPFYAPPRRKTSAEIISEARAAIYGDTSEASSGAGARGALRPLRTRRPFTPRDPQRTLFSDRTKMKDGRPPSAFNLKFLSLSESSEEAILTTCPQVSAVDEANIKDILFGEPPPSNVRKKHMLGKQSRSLQEREGWSGFTKLPHLSGRSKPLHRRNTNGTPVDESISESDLANAISTKPLGSAESRTTSNTGARGDASQSLSPDTSAKRRQFTSTKSDSCDLERQAGLGDIPVRHLAVQLPNTSSMDSYERLSVLEIAEALSQRNSDVERVLLLMEALRSSVERQPPATSLRDMSLRALYTHIDCEDERAIVAIARAMLTMQVTGPHLTTACKLVFKIARNDKNDHFFKDTDLLDLLIEGCGRADPVVESECCVYGAGALRFLSLEPGLRARARRGGALHIAALHLKILNAAKSENPRSASEKWSHALYQLTGALRNLAGGGGGAGAFVASGALGGLLAAAELHHTDRDVLTNVVRCLSVLSADDACCAWLCASPASSRVLVGALAACAARAPLAVRLAYTLGNMAAADDLARHNIYTEEGAMDVLLTVLESYTRRGDRDLDRDRDIDRDFDNDPDMHLVGSDLNGSDGSNEDVLIKTVRVVANICLAELVGRGVAHAHAERTIRALIGCLELAGKRATDTAAIRDLEEDDITMSRHEELATAALATLNNVTFYREPPEPPDPLSTLLETLCKVTCRWLGRAGAAACEAVRALGNLTRSADTAQLVVLEGALEHLPPFLNHEDESVRCAAAGVLVNVCGAGSSRQAADMTSLALTAASHAGDAASAALLARALWNALAHQALSASAVYHAVTALDVFIDDESVFAACEADHDARPSERRASDPELSNYDIKHDQSDTTNQMNRAYSVDQDLHIDSEAGDEGEFDVEGDVECECGPCRRLASWERLLGVAVPLLERLRGGRADAAVGTD